MEDTLQQKIMLIVCESIHEIWNLIGSENNEKIDILATKKYDKLYELFPRIEPLAIEGERDGIFCSQLQISQNINNCDVKVVIDPIDGTKGCASGGSRGISAIALAFGNKKEYKKVPDGLSCFCVASNVNEDILDILEDIGVNRPGVQERVKKAKNISTLHRQETKELWIYLLK